MDLQVVLDNLHDSHNASAVLRTCDGFGVGRYICCRRIIRLAGDLEGGVRYTRKWLAMPSYKTTATCAAALKAEGLRGGGDACR